MPRQRATTIPEPAATTTPRIRDFTVPRASAVRVEFDVRTVYDFAFSLSADAGETDDLPAEHRAWLAAAKASIGRPESILGGPAQGLPVLLVGLAVDRPEVRTAADLVRLVEGAPDDVLVRAVVAQDLREPSTAALAARALDHDPAAIDELVARTFDDHAAEEREPIAALFRDPGPVLDEARALLSRWLPRFAEIEPRVLAMLERDVALRADDRRTLPPGELIERTTGGIRWVSEVGVTRVILAPSYFTRPYNYLLGGDDWRLYGYPIADAALDGADPLAPPQDVVRLHRALGDETRLRILRLLRDRDLYLTEIAGLLELSKPTIKHHLALLRAAGLVTVTDEGALTYYTLRRDRLDSASSDLKRFLLG